MRLLIDECVDERLRLSFPFHDCMTARFAGLAGNNQQNLAHVRFPLLILCAPTNRLRDLLLLVGPANDALHSSGHGTVVAVRQSGAA